MHTTILLQSYNIWEQTPKRIVSMLALVQVLVEMVSRCCTTVKIRWSKKQGATPWKYCQGLSQLSPVSDFQCLFAVCTHENMVRTAAAPMKTHLQILGKLVNASTQTADLWSRLIQLHEPIWVSVQPCSKFLLQLPRRRSQHDRDRRDASIYVDGACDKWLMCSSRQAATGFLMPLMPMINRIIGSKVRS